ncbi:hypothetical protein L195_g042669 [Trifolium pratense]|uniref:Uncharacterized protein n=1 Tax=Trifolium pratense TaxID=57577 RepID=A0A2K3M749_TRIPR|nr:hypothetical protein L195_g042669 [Trifolium pratense]
MLVVIACGVKGLRVGRQEKLRGKASTISSSVVLCCVVEGNGGFD